MFYLRLVQSRRWDDVLANRPIKHANMRQGFLLILRDRAPEL
jgi:hypothetical protein